MQDFKDRGDEDEYRTLQSQNSVRHTLLARYFICGGDLNCHDLANGLTKI